MAFFNVCLLLNILSGLGMYESPLFLATHDEESGGRSVPTTPLQVAAPGISVHVDLKDGWHFALSIWFAFFFCLQCRCSQRLLPLTPLSRPPSLFPWLAHPHQACLCQEQPALGTRETTACWSQTLIGLTLSAVDQILMSILYLFSSNSCFLPIFLLQVLCWSVSGCSGLSGVSGGAKPAVWQAQRAVHQPGAFL